MGLAIWLQRVLPSRWCEPNGVGVVWPLCPCMWLWHGLQTGLQTEHAYTDACMHSHGGSGCSQHACTRKSCNSSHGWTRTVVLLGLQRSLWLGAAGAISKLWAILTRTAIP